MQSHAERDGDDRREQSQGFQLEMMGALVSIEIMAAETSAIKLLR